MSLVVEVVGVKQLLVLTAQVLQSQELGQRGKFSKI